MTSLSRKHKTAIIKIISKWRTAYAGTTPVNRERICELINVAYSMKTKQVRNKNRRALNRWKTVKLGRPTIHFLQSPVAFDIAQAVCRGRLSKKAAELLCVSYGINSSFVAALRRDSMTSSFGNHHWYSGSSALTDVWKATLADASNAAQDAAFSPPPDISEDASVADKTRRRNYQRFAPAFPDMPGLLRDQRLRELQNNDLGLTDTQLKSGGQNMVKTMSGFNCREPEHAFNQQLLEIPWSSTANSATLSRCARASVNSWSASYIDAEIVCELLGVADVKKTWAYELMREAQVVMFFDHQTLVLAEQPTMHFNAAGELHDDEGPAVRWADGAKQYYIAGHALGPIGELIVDHPEQLTLAHINAEDNEEIKRLAIERFGWGRYLDESGATLIARRENAVDNTIEALVSVRNSAYRRTWGWRSTPEQITIEQRKLILSCRSTARQYFLAVPETTSSCEEGQRWMAEGANTPHVAALRYPVRVIGAS